MWPAGAAARKSALAGLRQASDALERNNVDDAGTALDSTSNAAALVALQPVVAAPLLLASLMLAVTLAQ